MKLSKIKVLIYALLIIVCYSSIAWAKETTTELNNIGQLAVTSIDNGGKLLFSDSPELVDKDGIQRLGAKGIVEIDNQLKIIFGPNAKTLKKYISEMK